MVLLASFSLSTFLFLSLTLLLFTLSTTTAAGSQPQPLLRSSRLVDLLIRDYTFKRTIRKTGKIFAVPLPANLSGIQVSAARMRCGSLRRYGMKIGEFRLDAGVSSFPCSERIIIVRQNLGDNLSSIYYENYELSGYKFVSPVLGLLAYNSGELNGSRFEVEIQAEKAPILINFTNLRTENYDHDGGGGGGHIPLCASFGRDGRLTVAKQGNANVCMARENGHFGLVVETPLIPARKEEGWWWKLAVGVLIVAFVGVSLMAVLMVGLISKMKRKKKEEMERMTYEEEALQVTMAGHIRAPTAPRQY